VRVIRLKQGLIVLMNGTSSSGKTSISMELINQKEILFHHLSIDDFFYNYNDFIDNKFPDIEPTREVDNQVVGQILFDPIFSVYYSTIKLFSEMGLNVIVDTVIDNDKRFNDYLDALFNHPTLFVGVICSKEELIRREQIRGDREIGLANSQFNKVYCFNEYDLEVNTEELNPTECAEKILSFIKSDKDYSAFKKLSKRDISVS
jgi:chloramphenicol 3-O phosphotransferase